MRGSLVAVALIAACSGRGVDLEVTYDGPFDRVEVFVGNDSCQVTDPVTHDSKPCPGVAWMPGMIRPPGDVYTTNGDDSRIAITSVKSSHATMHLEATDGFRQPTVIAIVAFHGATPVAFGTIWGARIPANSAEHWNVDLDDAGIATDKVQQAPAAGEPTKRVYAWERQRVDNPGELSRCLAMQFWDDDDHVWKSKFIVPESDPDCDGQDPECDPLYANFNANAGPSLCVAPAPNVTQMPCTVGASHCADGYSADPSCMLPSSALTCVPQQACTVCAGAGDTLSCLIEAFGTLPPDPALTAFKCTFHPTDGGNPCSNTDPTNTAVFTLPVNCSDVDVRELATPFTTSSSPHTATIGNAMVDVNLAGGGGLCGVYLKWSQGAVDAGVATGKTFLFVFTSSVTSNTIVVPLRIEFSGPASACLGGSEVNFCTHTAAATTDTMYQCMM